MKVKKTIVKKYAEGSASVEAKPKKMNFFKRLKAKEDEAATELSKIDAQDDLEKNGYKAPEPVQKLEIKTPSIGASKSSYAPDKVNPVAVTKTEVSSKPIGWNDEGEMEMVKAYQKRHGLKADGVWGKETAQYYANSQKAKSPKKMAIKKTSTPTETKTTVATKPAHTPAMATGRKGSDGNIYFSNGRTYNPKTGEKGTVGDGSIYSDKDKTKRAASADMNTWGKATTKNKEVKSNSHDSARIAEYMYPDPEMHGARVNNRETAKKLVEIDKKGEETTGNLLRNVGIGATGAALIAGGIYAAKRKGKASKALGRVAGEVAEEVKPSQKLLPQRAESTVFKPNQAGSNYAVRKTTQTNVPASGAARQPVYKGGAPETVRHNTEDYAKWAKNREGRTQRKLEESKYKQLAGMPKGVRVGETGQVISQSGRPMSNSEIEKLASQTTNKKVMPVNEAGKKANAEVNVETKAPVKRGRPSKANKSDAPEGKRKATEDEKKKQTKASDLF